MGCFDGVVAVVDADNDAHSGNPPYYNRYKMENLKTKLICVCTICLWYLVITTKRLEKDFGNAAYATIRAFVMKFASMGLLKARKAGNKVLYRTI